MAMRCPHCGAEPDSLTGKCDCREAEAEAEVKILTPEEREGFHGVTIDDRPAERNNHEYSNSSGQRIYVRQVTFGSGGGGLWTKLVMLAVFAAFIFVFLPVLLFFVAAAGLGLVLWLFFRR
jgi:hypothetical protein